ncbi:DeoR/GlpR family DNA-binding transcription regulator [Halopseudomonas pelagia]|uniref:DeoR/GlpR family DNA-binding transcription regulator n=1 Tax=Halopseudomonas pelagia TaxID=553151 RepID=UPI00039CA7BB|nr:DeoR/GlpR family DNA-binding transcription regulator [Halopseudomonas pelagia]
MLNQPRLDEIMRRLNGLQRVLVTDLAAELHVSDETIRRDLKHLEEIGKLRRIHGGAILPRLNVEQPLYVRSKIKPRAKAQVAQAALGLIREGMSLFLDTGTTTQALATRLTQFQQLNVFTNSLDIAQILTQQSESRVVLVPGEVRRNDNALIGPHTLEFVSQFHFDIVFMGIGAIDLKLGFMDYEEPEALLRRCLVKQCQRSVILADEGKFDRKTFVKTLPFSGINTLVSNKPLSGDYQTCLEKAHVEVIIP